MITEEKLKKMTKALGSGLTGLSAEIVNQMHFGGGNLRESFRPDGTKKTKEEIYSELIAKKASNTRRREGVKRFG